MPHRVIVVYDVPGWCYHTRARCLQSHAPGDIDVTIASQAEFERMVWGDFDLIYLLDYATAGGVRRALDYRAPRTPLVVSFNKDSNSRQAMWPTARAAADYVVCNNEDRWRVGGQAERTCCISNGIDLSIYRPTVPIEQRPHRVVWTGSSSPSKGKGWDEVLVPLREQLPALGFEVDFRPINDIDASVYPQDRMVEWYNGASYLVCPSSTEGTPNIALEAVACGCVLVSTWIANVQEFGVTGKNCVICPRGVKDFIYGLQYARDHRERLSAGGLEAIQSWGYAAPGDRAQWFYQLWRRIIRDGAESVPPFSYREKHWSAI